jgi:HNH endonuclease
MADIAPELADKMMVLCGRHCCLCRRYRPTKLQVHHIRERAQGGTDDEDNLIVICLSCHTDVHSKVPFARRFTADELKMHRDKTIQMVNDGVLVGNDAPNFSTSTIIARVPPKSADELRLRHEAIELLLSAVNAEGSQQGTIYLMGFDGGANIQAGVRNDFIPQFNRRAEAKYKAALQELEDAGLIQPASDELWLVTDEGYVVADDVASSAG